MTNTRIKWVIPAACLALLLFIHEGSGVNCTFCADVTGVDSYCLQPTTALSWVPVPAPTGKLTFAYTAPANEHVYFRGESELDFCVKSCTNNSTQCTDDLDYVAVNEDGHWVRYFDFQQGENVTIIFPDTKSLLTVGLKKGPDPSAATPSPTTRSTDVGNQPIGKENSDYRSRLLDCVGLVGVNQVGAVAVAMVHNYTHASAEFTAWTCAVQLDSMDSLRNNKDSKIICRFGASEEFVPVAYGTSPTLAMQDSSRGMVAFKSKSSDIRILSLDSKQWNATTAISTVFMPSSYHPFGDSMFEYSSVLGYVYCSKSLPNAASISIHCVSTLTGVMGLLTFTDYPDASNKFAGAVQESTGHVFLGYGDTNGAALNVQKLTAAGFQGAPIKVPIDVYSSNNLFRMAFSKDVLIIVSAFDLAVRTIISSDSAVTWTEITRINIEKLLSSPTQLTLDCYQEQCLFSVSGGPPATFIPMSPNPNQPPASDPQQPMNPPPPSPLVEGPPPPNDQPQTTVRKAFLLLVPLNSWQDLKDFESIPSDGDAGELRVFLHGDGFNTSLWKNVSYAKNVSCLFGQVEINCVSLYVQVGSQFPLDLDQILPLLICPVSLAFLFIYKLGGDDEFAILIFGSFLVIGGSCLLYYMITPLASVDHFFPKHQPGGLVPYPNPEVRIIGLGFVLFCFFYLFFIFLDFITLRLRVYDVKDRKIRAIFFWYYNLTCCLCCANRNNRCCIISYRWDPMISSAKDFEKSPTLQRSFERARSLNFRFVLVDVVTLDQRSVDAKSVLRFIKFYATMPVIVGVETPVEIKQYKGRFWTNIEMLRYARNPKVYSLGGEVPTRSHASMRKKKHDSQKKKRSHQHHQVVTSTSKPVSKKHVDDEDDDEVDGDGFSLESGFNTVGEVISSRRLNATFNLDRLRVYLQEVPFSSVLFGLLFRTLNQLNKVGMDVDLARLDTILGTASIAYSVMNVKLWNRLGRLRFLWLLAFVLLPIVLPPKRFCSLLQVAFFLAFGVEIGIVVYYVITAPVNDGSKYVAVDPSTFYFVAALCVPFVFRTLFSIGLAVHLRRMIGRSTVTHIAAPVDDDEESFNAMAAMTPHQPSGLDQFEVNNPQQKS
jgi:hypothetical protein